MTDREFKIIKQLAEFLQIFSVKELKDFIERENYRANTVEGMLNNYIAELLK